MRLLLLLGALLSPAAAQTLTLDPAASAALPDTGAGGAWGDYDGDGDPDLAFGSDIYRNDGGTLVRDADASGDVALSGYVYWVDYDVDGDLDLISGAPTTRAYRNDGTGRFAFDAALSSTVPTTDLFSEPLAIGDYTGDGAPDLAVVLIGDASETRLYRNDGAGTFSRDTAVDLPGGGFDLVASWGDADADGDLDLLLVGEFELPGEFRNATFVYRNDGGALTLDAPRSDALIEELAEARALWTDYDADDDDDLVLAGDDFRGSGARTFVYRNDGTALALDVQASDALPDVAFGALTAGDYDGDGDPDLAVTGQTPGNAVRTQIVRNDGGAYTVDAQASATVAEVFGRTAAWADYDGDGADDLLISGSTSPSTFVSLVYRTSGAVSTEAAPPPAARLLPPAPNPARASVGVRVEMRAPATTRVDVIDALGRVVAVLADGAVPAGRTDLRWDASAAAPGAYVVRLVTPDGVAVQRVSVAR